VWDFGRVLLVCRKCTNTHVVSTNVAKLLVCTHEYDVINSVYAVTMTNISLCHSLILDFDRGTSTQAVAPGTTRPLHATGLETDNVMKKFYKCVLANFTKEKHFTFQVGTMRSKTLF